MVSIVPLLRPTAASILDLYLLVRGLPQGSRPTEGRTDSVQGVVSVVAGVAERCRLH